jgi:chromodomain-helicase-DNA-binding protein 7
VFFKEENDQPEKNEAEEKAVKKEGEAEKDEAEEEQQIVKKEDSEDTAEMASPPSGRVARKSGDGATLGGTSPVAKVEKIKTEEGKAARHIQVEEFLVKFKNFSYLHCQWQTEAELLRYFLKFFYTFLVEMF